MKVLIEGADPDQARLIVVLLHGGGSGASDILSLSQHFSQPDLCWLAPQSGTPRWYEGDVTESRSAKEPFLTMSVETVWSLLENHPDRPLVLAGFSDGAGVASELVARYAPKLAGAWIASGGLIGSEDELPGPPPAPLDKLPVIVSGSLQDPNIPVERLRTTASFFKEHGAAVTTEFYAGSTHLVTAEELDRVREMFQGIKG